MDTKLHVVYVPGLGDVRVAGQQTVVRTWRLWGVSAELFRMNWSDTEPWERKMQRLLDKLDELAAQNKIVALVGSSAGASAVINAYARRKSQIVGCVLIAGKINHPENIGPSYQLRSPAFVQSAVECERSLAALSQAERQRILSRYAVHDGVISRADSRFAGAHNRTVLSFGHAFTIGTQIVLGAPGFLRFLKNTARRTVQ